MFDLSILNIYHPSVFLIVFLSLYTALHLVVNYFKPDGSRVPSSKSSHSNHPVYYVGPYIIAVVTIAGIFLLFRELPLAMGLIIGGVLIMLIGSADEKNGLSPLRQFIWQAAIAATLVYFGWTIPHISNPIGDSVINLDWIAIGNWILPGSVLAIIWLLFVMNAFNWLDGVDGLAGSVALAVFITLAAISLLPATQDNKTLTLAIVGAAASLAFLIWNFWPARVYLGTAGSWFLGLFIGLVSLIGGGKLATALLVLAIPALDAVLVIGQRLLEKKVPWKGDREKHLHFRLLNRGFSPRTISVSAGLITIVLGLAAVHIHTFQKIGLFFLVGAGMLILVSNLSRRSLFRRSV